jgi:hypothetical protein
MHSCAMQTWALIDFFIYAVASLFSLRVEDITLF